MCSHLLLGARALGSLILVVWSAGLGSHLPIVRSLTQHGHKLRRVRLRGRQLLHLVCPSLLDFRPECLALENCFPRKYVAVNGISRAHPLSDHAQYRRTYASAVGEDKAKVLRRYSNDDCEAYLGMHVR